MDTTVSIILLKGQAPDETLLAFLAQYGVAKVISQDTVRVVTEKPSLKPKPEGAYYYQPKKAIGSQRFMLLVGSGVKIFNERNRRFIKIDRYKIHIYVSNGIRGTFYSFDLNHFLNSYPNVRGMTMGSRIAKMVEAKQYIADPMELPHGEALERLNWVRSVEKAIEVEEDQ